MTTQDNNAVTLSFVESFESYTADSKSMADLKARLEDTRKILEPVIRAHKIAIGDNKAWKEKREIFYPLLKELEGPAQEDSASDISDEEVKAEKRKAENRITAWLGVIRTCLEYQILPTDKNADRLRKTKVWTGLNGNGKLNPNWVDPDKKAEATQPATTAPATQPAIGNALALATMQPGAATTTASKTTEQTTTKAPSVSPATPQKASEPVHPLTSNVSSSDAPLSSREHFKVLFNHMLKNETFRGEFCEILAMMLDIEKATLTRCMVQANDTIKV